MSLVPRLVTIWILSSDSEGSRRKAEAISIRQAASRIRDELHVKDDSGPRKSPTDDGLTDPLRELVEELRRERDQWRELALNLQKQVEELTARALPPPRRRWWWPWRQRASTD